MATTALTLITRAMRAANIVAMNEDIEGVESAAAKDVLNMMLDQWNLQGLMAYYKLNETFNLVASKVSYIIGPDEAYDFNTEMPMKITSAFIRSGTNDYPLRIISNDEYQNIYDKSVESIPKCLLYLPRYNIPYIEVSEVRCGIIYLWPVPDSSDYDIGLSQTKRLTTATDLTTTMEFMPGYESAIIYNLAVELCIHFNRVFSLGLADKARETKATIKGANLENEVLTNDCPMSLRQGGAYNIETDTIG